MSRPTGFLVHAVEGFVDGLAERFEYIRGQQRRMMWKNHLHAMFRDKDAPAPAG